MNTTPNINQCYAMIVQDESQKALTGDSYSTGKKILDPTALFTRSSPRSHGYEGVGGGSCSSYFGSGSSGSSGAGPFSGYLVIMLIHVLVQDQYNHITYFLNKSILGEENNGTSDVGGSAYIIGIFAWHTCFNTSQPDVSSSWIVDISATTNMDLFTGKVKRIGKVHKVHNLWDCATISPHTYKVNSRDAFDDNVPGDTTLTYTDVNSYLAERVENPQVLSHEHVDDQHLYLVHENVLESEHMDAQHLHPVNENVDGETNAIVDGKGIAPENMLVTQSGDRRKSNRTSRALI
ncbi:hypothetical protein T459_30742 [Capsicum annuum]|uniref:Uncharacterized protein n=1 Tax=Capsicum annuum TaxID=4072 RepID=A0A2G2Y981_CAPAN|nr:hypothetical protein T459_30742 [Capsicum annuum]